MARRAFPRPHSLHEKKVNQVLRAHESTTSSPTSLPIPVEMIVERTYGIEIVWDEIAEPPGSMILGALAPEEKRIYLNSAHEAMFGDYIGPERFTIAHELGHWLYDAEVEGQQTLDLQVESAEVFCYHRESPSLSEDLRIREVNANNFAANLLLPATLVRAHPLDSILSRFNETAEEWGVSRTTLRIRLETLGLISSDAEGDPKL